jgi:glycerol-3-phosphate dehydrogenase
MALRINDFLSKGRNRGVYSERHLPRGKVIDVNQTQSIFPAVNPHGLKGGAIWYDACMPDSQRLLITVIKWACGHGATALNYVEARKLLKHKEGVVGVKAVDRKSGESHEYSANVVVNAGGPWCRDLATSFDRDEPTLFKGSLMWNVLLDREAVSDHAVAVTPKKVDGETYFLVPWKGRLFAGTGHVPWVKGTAMHPMPSTDQLRDFLDDLNLAVPGLELSLNDILHVFPGLLPVTEAGGVTLSVREVILDHGSRKGPRGLWSVSGVKFTTARLVAEKTLNRIFSHKMSQMNFQEETFSPPQCVRHECGIFHYDWLPNSDGSIWKDALKTIIREESVQHLDDLIFRRTTLWENPSRPMKIASAVCDLFDWDGTRCSKEINKLDETERARRIE